MRGGTLIVVLILFGCATSTESATSQCMARVLIGAGAQNIKLSPSKDITWIEYSYTSSGTRRQSQIPLNNQPNSDGSYLYRTPADMGFDGPLTLTVYDVLEAECHAIGYDLTM